MADDKTRCLLCDGELRSDIHIRPVDFDRAYPSDSPTKDVSHIKSLPRFCSEQCVQDAEEFLTLVQSKLAPDEVACLAAMLTNKVLFRELTTGS